MNSVNGHVLNRAARRRVENNTPAPSGLGTAEDTLARIIGESVALHLAQLLPQALAQVAQQTACLLCAVAAKQEQAAHKTACEQAAKAGEPMPDAPPVNIQQAFTLMPMQAAVNVPPVACPVCFDHLQTGPEVRPVGLVGPNGKPIIAKGR